MFRHWWWIMLESCSSLCILYPTIYYSTVSKWCLLWYDIILNNLLLLSWTIPPLLLKPWCVLPDIITCYYVQHRHSAVCCYYMRNVLKYTQLPPDFYFLSVSGLQTESKLQIHHELPWNRLRLNWFMWGQNLSAFRSSPALTSVRGVF